MKHLHAIFEDDKLYEALLKKKGELTWAEFILQLLPESEESE